MRFAASAAPSTFSLDLPTPSSTTFLFGTVDLQEPNAGGGIDPSETDDLGVTASFIFTSPLATSQNLVAVGTATIGPVADSHVDYALTWAPVFVNFSNGGAFRIDLSDLSYAAFPFACVISGGAMRITSVRHCGRLPAPSAATAASNGTRRKGLPVSVGPETGIA